MEYLYLRDVDNTHGGLSTIGVDVNSEQIAVQQHAQEAPHHHLEARDSGLYLIGIFKLAKAIFFLGVSLGALHFIHHDLGDTVDRIFRELHFDPESHVVDFITDKVALITHHKLRLISVGSVLYAGLCCTEAYGLLRRRTWAEFVTLWLSASFLPWESYEIVRHPNLWHVTIIVVNLAVVAYLVWMLQRKKRRQLPT
jgi:uncharacterized membrane protein (DUF2068 family)